MLINGRHTEEVRVAIIDEAQKLQGYRVAVAESGVQRGNIYRGVVVNIEPSLDAAFIEFGAGRHGFLTRHDVIEQAYHHGPAKGAATIDKVLQKGQPIMVQVTRDAVDNKGATLTTNLSLAGRYLVLMPFEDSKGVSRKVEDDDLRRKLRDKVKNLVAGDFGFIVRTNAADQTKTDLKADLEQLKRLWKQVLDENAQGKGPRLLYDDQDLVVQVLRDHLDASIAEVLVDDEELLARAERYISAVMPRSKLSLSLYRERLPLFSRHNLEPQIAAIYRRTASLPSGGSIVIDGTEALTAIDVNSGKSKGGERQRDTAVSTNLEAADEVARQLRLRDIGGLVVVDFIDMRSRKHQQAVEKAIKEAMKPDRARSSQGRISPNGLMEINRQRVGQSLSMRTHVPCPTCNGLGRLVNPDLMALGLLRRIEARAATGRLARVQVALHPQVANAVQNRRRGQLAALECELDIVIEIVGRADLELSGERIEWQAREAPAEVPTRSDVEPDNGEDEARSKRRKRRRGRRKKETAGEADQVSPVKASPPADPDQTRPAVDAGEGRQAEDSVESAGPPAAQSKAGRRRGRRNRKKRSSADGAAPAEAAAGDSPATPATEERADTAGDGAPDDDDRADTGAVKRRPRRRRRRRPPAAKEP